jgi:hypothetical protein
MNRRQDQDADKTAVGLCFDCVHGRKIESDRGSVFYLCELAASDPSYAKYPCLPVMRWAGYERTPDSFRAST